MKLQKLTLKQQQEINGGFYFIPFNPFASRMRFMQISNIGWTMPSFRPTMSSFSAPPTPVAAVAPASYPAATMGNTIASSVQSMLSGFFG